MQRVILLTDDHFLGEVLGTYLRHDQIEVVRPATTADAIRRVGEDAGALVVDLAKRGLCGQEVISLSQRAERTGVPLLVISAQPRRDVIDFAAIVRATDVLSKSERMAAIATRIRLWIKTPRSTGDTDGFIIPELSLGT